jgi:hypothetical protein
MPEFASDSCQLLATQTAGQLSWELDARLGCVVAAFDVGLAESTRASILAATGHDWNTDNIGSAPPAVRELAGKLGLRAGQSLFASDPVNGAVLYGAWWPWGSGKRISLRVGASGVDLSTLGSWFGL